MNRLILGSMGSVFGNKDKGLTKRWAMKRLNQLFPNLENVKFDDAWYGQIALTPDHLPRIYNLDKNVYSTIGYNGRGITTGTIFGKAVADMIKSDSTESLPVPLSDLKIDQLSSTKSTLFRLVFFANQLIKSI